MSINLPSLMIHVSINDGEALISCGIKKYLYNIAEKKPWIIMHIYIFFDYYVINY
jgi:hypothetical protein